MVKILDYEIKCSKCKINIDGEITYTQLKELYIGENEMELECPNCGNNFDLNKSFFNKTIKNLSNEKRDEIKKYIRDNGKFSFEIFFMKNKFLYFFYIFFKILFTPLFF